MLWRGLLSSDRPAAVGFTPDGTARDGPFRCGKGGPDPGDWSAIPAAFAPVLLTVFGSPCPCSGLSDPCVILFVGGAVVERGFFWGIYPPKCTTKAASFCLRTAGVVQQRQAPGSPVFPLARVSLWE